MTKSVHFGPGQFLEGDIDADLSKGAGWIAHIRIVRRPEVGKREIIVFSTRKVPEFFKLTIEDGDLVLRVGRGAVTIEKEHFAHYYDRPIMLLAAVSLARGKLKLELEIENETPAYDL